jgi:outer membrane scaffolding protein for murein synthesis (MipA/OmpV family)
MIAGRTWLLFCALSISEVALAGQVMDFIRSYDLNDYSLGVAVTAAETPYIGGATSFFTYPYLTSFRDSSFTRDWFLISEGDLGIRFVTESDWEFGVVGRVQTLGFGDNDAPELRGLNDRTWTIEVAPIIGWRGWPVHIKFKTYFETLGRHGGNTSQLIFSLPKEYERGFIIPSIRAVHRNSEYTDYYFGVDADEARPTRPQYQAGASLSARARIRWGYAFTEKWLLSGSLSYEHLDSEITDSPIAGQDDIWSVNIGLAYNDDIFKPRISDLGEKRQPKLEIKMAAFSDSGDAKVTRDAAEGAPGDEIDLEDVLGVSLNDTVMQFDAIYRFNDFHRLEIGYHELSRNGTATLNNDIIFGDTVFAAGTTVNTSFETEVLRVSYAYSLMNDEQKELGVMAGVHLTKGTTDIESVTTGERERSDVSTPLPVIGLHGSVQLGADSTLGGRAQVFGLEFDRVDGHMIYMMLEWQRRFGDDFSAGLAYNFYRTKLDAKNADAHGTLQTRHHGPVIFISANF